MVNFIHVHKIENCKNRSKCAYRKKMVAYVLKKRVYHIQNELKSVFEKGFKD